MLRPRIRTGLSVTDVLFSRIEKSTPSVGWHWYLRNMNAIPNGKCIESKIKPYSSFTCTDNLIEFSCTHSFSHTYLVSHLTSKIYFFYSCYHFIIRSVRSPSIIACPQNFLHFRDRCGLKFFCGSH